MPHRHRPPPAAIRRSRQLGAALLAMLALSGCGSLTPEQKGAAIGAVAGSIAGHPIARGNPLGTIGGAVAGGILGHELGKVGDRD